MDLDQTSVTFADPGCLEPECVDSELLISFCNQTASPELSLCVLSTLNRKARWIDLSELFESARNSLAGVCGMCQAGESVIIATQGECSALASVVVTEAKVLSHILLKKCKDPHSLVFNDGYIYLVSTGTNQIYRIRFEDGHFGAEELFWGYPGVGYQKDEVHLNGLTVDCDGFIASCFGPRTMDNVWGANGRVFYIDSGKSICERLNQPHSPTIFGSRLAFAESATGKVWLCTNSGKQSWTPERKIQLDGYVRGLVLGEHQFRVGVSANRKLSRSQHSFIYGDGAENDSRVFTVSLTSGEIVDQHPLLICGREPYDLLEIKKQTVLQAESELIEARIKSMEARVDQYAADLATAHRQILERRDIGSELVTVIIPTYNRAHLIAASIRSVLEQTYTNLEVIVVDDGSTDNTTEVMAGFTDPRLRYICQPNRGRSNARNHALSLASGEYVTFLDSDDLYVPSKVRIQVEYLKNHPGTGMVYTSAHCIDEQGEMLNHRYEASVSGLVYTHITFFTPVTITLPTVMTYRHIIDRVGGFDENMHRFEDTDLWRRISKYCRIDAMPEKTCLLRTHNDNSLLNQNPNHIVSALDYYAAKILSEDVEFDVDMRRKGLMDLYLYYGHALMSVPQFAAEGKQLLKIAAHYRSEVVRAKGVGSSRALRAEGRRSGLRALLFWARWLMRFVYYRSANAAYQSYIKAKRLFKGG